MSSRVIKFLVVLWEPWKESVKLVLTIIDDQWTIDWLMTKELLHQTWVKTDHIMSHFVPSSTASPVISLLWPVCSYGLPWAINCTTNFASDVHVVCDIFTKAHRANDLPKSNREQLRMSQRTHLELGDLICQLEWKGKKPQCYITYFILESLFPFSKTKVPVSLLSVSVV